MLKAVKRRSIEHWRKLAQEAIARNVPTSAFSARLNSRVQYLGGTIEAIRLRVQSDILMGGLS